MHHRGAASVDRQLKLALFNQPVGRHPGGWRLPGAQGRADDVDWVVHTARLAEDALFDLFFCEDSLAAPRPGHVGPVRAVEPLTLLAAVARETRHIGLVATLSTTFSEPYNAARQFASLDRISHGRAGWNAVTSQLADAAANFGLTEFPDHETRYRRAAEFVDVVLRLWSSFPADFHVGDAASGVYTDLSRVQPIDHVGEFFSVRGPLDVPASEQGRPVVAQSGSSDDGIDLAGRGADVVYTVAETPEEGRAFRGRVHDAARRHGRDPRAVLVFPGVLPLVGATTAQAQELWGRLQELQDTEAGLRQLSWRSGLDLVDADPDQLVADLPPSALGRSRVQVLFGSAVRRGWTLGELARHAAATNGHRLLVGSADDVTDDLQRWFESGAADGFTIIPTHMPAGLEAFVEHVVPRLQDRGVFRRAYEGETLRENLGLPVPVRPLADRAG